MKLTEEDGWQLLTIDPKDNLGLVKSPFLELLTPEVRRVFADAPGHFRQVAAQAPSPAMSAWLRAVIAKANWGLELFVWPVAGVKESSFCWGNEPSLEAFAARLFNRKKNAPDPAGASIGLPQKSDLTQFPPLIQRYYASVGEVRWSPPGNAGQIYGSQSLRPVGGFSYYGGDRDSVEAKTTYTWGITENGDTFVFNQKGGAGWFSPGSDIEITDTIEGMLEKLYGALLRGKPLQREY